MTTQMKKEQYATCEECERLCYTGGEHEEGEEYICEDCEEEEEEEELSYDCKVCKKHLYITEDAKCEWRELCWRCCEGRQADCDCAVCVDNNPECAEPTFDDLLGDDRLDFSNPENVAQFTAFVQANFTREEIFPETKPIAISDSISGEVSRELETLQAQNAKLVAENQKLQQQLVAIKSLLSSN